MCFRFFSKPLAVFEHRLTKREEERLYKDIRHYGAVLDINNEYKEDTIVVDKLRAYLEELRTAHAAILAEDNNTAIEAEVAEFRETVTAKYEADRTAKLLKVESDMNCIEELINRELTTVTTEDTVDPATV